VLSFLFRRTSEDEVRIEKRYQAGLPVLRVERNQLKQALLNIFLNARQAMAASGGVLKITIEHDADRNGIRERIEDNGCGIAPENLKRVFDPFFTLRPAGTGLGLSISKRVIDSLGGQIALESAKGKGTTVEIFLPLAEGRAA
jgi:signal transduction histidine kinase